MSDRRRRIDITAMREAIGAGRISWRKHVLVRLAERGIAQADVRSAISTGEVIREYPEDMPFPSALLMGRCTEGPLHVVAGYDECNRHCYIITAYVPSLDVFEADYRTRRSDG